MSVRPHEHRAVVAYLPDGAPLEQWVAEHAMARADLVHRDLHAGALPRLLGRRTPRCPTPGASEQNEAGEYRKVRGSCRWRVLMAVS